MQVTRYIVDYNCDFNPSFTRTQLGGEGIYERGSSFQRIKGFFSNLFYKARFYLDAYTSEPKEKNIKLLYAKCVEAEARLDAAEYQEMTNPKIGTYKKLFKIQKEFFDALNDLQKALTEENYAMPFRSLMMNYAHVACNPQEKMHSIYSDEYLRPDFTCRDMLVTTKDEMHAELFQAMRKPITELEISLRAWRRELRSGYKEFGMEALSPFVRSWQRYVNCHTFLSELNVKLLTVDNTHKVNVLQSFIKIRLTT